MKRRVILLLAEMLIVAMLVTASATAFAETEPAPEPWATELWQADEDFAVQEAGEMPTDEDPIPAQEESMPEELTGDLLSLEGEEDAASNPETETVSNAAPVGVPVDGSHFPDAAFRSYVGRQVDRDGDGLLSDEERGDVLTIILENQGVASLKGVEYFPRLLTLFVSGNQLTELDLRANPLVSQVQADDNRLTGLDLSGQTDLDFVSCSGNRLTSLDVTRQPRLTTLICNDNQLTALDLTGNPMLKLALVGGNALSALNVRGLSKLETLDCADNRLTSLDIGGCSSLTALNCDDNRLTALGVGGNPTLTTLSCGGNQLTALDVDSCPNLLELDCADNRLSSVNVGGCPALLRLFCSGNGLTALDVTRNPALEWLYCRANRLESLNLEANRALLLLDCGDNRLQGLDLRRNCSLLAVWASDNPMKTIDLGQAASLKMLNLGGNPLLGVELGGCAALKACLSNAPGLEGGNACFGGRVSFSFSFSDGVGMSVSEKAMLTIRAATRVMVDGGIVYGAPFPTKVTLSKTGVVELKLNKTLRLKAGLKPGNAAAALTWTSGDPKIASVDENGLVTPHKAGTVKITVATDNGKTASVKVRVVQIKAVSVSLNRRGTVVLKRGATLRLKATVNPKTSTDRLTWTSSKSQVAEVSDTGLVTALNKGTTVIQVRTSSGRKAKVKIRVK